MFNKRVEKKIRRKKCNKEHPAGYGANRIDIVVKDKSDLIFYEIKTYPTLKTSIREAIGQLMEYSLWTNQKKAKQLVVITQPHGDFEKAKIYSNICGILTTFHSITSHTILKTIFYLKKFKQWTRTTHQL